VFAAEAALALADSCLLTAILNGCDSALSPSPSAFPFQRFRFQRFNFSPLPPFLRVIHSPTERYVKILTRNVLYGKACTLISKHAQGRNIRSAVGCSALGRCAMASKNYAAWRLTNRNGDRAVSSRFPSRGRSVSNRCQQPERALLKTRDFRRAADCTPSLPLIGDVRDNWQEVIGDRNPTIRHSLFGISRVALSPGGANIVFQWPGCLGECTTCRGLQTRPDRCCWRQPGAHPNEPLRYDLTTNRVLPGGRGA